MYRLLFLVFFLGVAHAQEAYIRVLLTTAPQVEIYSDFASRARTSGGMAQQKPEKSMWLLASNNKNTVVLDGMDSKSNSINIDQQAFHPVLAVDGRLYRGSLRIYSQNNRLHVVNILPVEEYLYSVLMSEMSKHAPTEALKAQAILARTYALGRLNPKNPYDICASESCQVYKGVSQEHEHGTLAVDLTYRQVLMYKNTLAKVFFSSDNGGFVADSNEVWSGADIGYLNPKPDPYSPATAWQKSFTAEQVQKSAMALGITAKINNMRVHTYTTSGRVGSLVLDTAKGTTVLGSNSASKLLRGLGAPSTLVNLQYQNGVLYLQGYGYGHGVGLSQKGAMAMAEQGFSHHDILQFYFPDTYKSQYHVALTGAKVEQQAVTFTALPD